MIPPLPEQRPPGFLPNACCPDCGAEEGELHGNFPHCGLEACPLCLHWQLADCECLYRINGLQDYNRWTKATNYLPPKIFTNGPTTTHRRRWERLIRKVGRIPFFHFPTVCQRCGLQNPPMFMVPRIDWERIVPRDHWHDHLCWACFETLCTYQHLPVSTPRWI